MMTRRQEVSGLLQMTRQQMLDAAAEHLVILPDLDALHRHFAQSVADEIAANNAAGRPTNLILPVGPIGQYPLLAQIVNTRRLTLANCRLFMMDEHCDEKGQALPPDHPLSFRRQFNKAFLDHLPSELRPPAGQIVFPDHANVEELRARIDAVGGIGTCYGGIGIHGHVAFNEPEPGVRDSDPRVVDLNDFTRTINAVRAGIGGNLEAYPRRGITLGMRQILGSRRIRLYCRNGIPLDWANTVLRLALFGEPGEDYPVTLIRDHPDYVVVTDENTARQPGFIL